MWSEEPSTVKVLFNTLTDDLKISIYVVGEARHVQGSV